MPFSSKNQLPNGPKNSNEEFFDALIRHQIGLLRVNGSVRNQVIDILNSKEQELSDLIFTRTQGISRNFTKSDKAKLARLQKLIKNLRTQTWKEVFTLLKSELTEIAFSEPEFVSNAFQATSVVLAPTVIPSRSLLREIVTARPFEGRTLNQWSRNIAQADINRINSEVVTGITQGETRFQISQRVVGTARIRGTDGATEITRTQAAALVRTAIINITNQVKQQYYNLNSDLFDKELYVATLDGRTSAICRSLDGQQFDIGKGPIPPLHFNCRSLRVAIIDGVELSKRPLVASTEKQLLREFTSQNGLPNITSRKNLPRGFKGKFDQFSRDRVRELTGTVDGKINYQDFLKRQSVEFQNDVLGKTKARLFRRGDLTLDKFVNRRGDELTLSQLAEKETQAFINAGLEPEDFS